MKSEKDFIKSMWGEINTREQESLQKSIAREINKRLFFRDMLVYGIITALFVAGSLLAFLSTPAIVYVIVTIAFSIAFFAERLSYKKSQEVFNENPNHN